MEDNIFDKFGRATGYGQMAPGRDLPQNQNELARKRGVMQSAISGAPGGMPQGGTTTPFNGAKQTIGAATAAPSKRGIASAIQGASSGLGDVLGQMSRPQSQQQQNTGFLGGLMDNAQAQAPAQSPARNVGPLSPGATVAPAGPSGFAPSIAPGEPAPGQEFDRPADRQAPAYKVNLEGFGGMRADGSAKLGSVEHGLKSPKYAFANLMQGGQYGYDQMGDALAKLQETHGDLYNGWSMVPGKEVMRFTGDPSQLHSSWNGVDEVDLVRNFTQDGTFDPSKAAFWWGASTPGERAGVARGPIAPMATQLPPISSQDALTQAIEGNVSQQDPAAYSAQVRQQILQALQGGQISSKLQQRLAS